VFSITSKGNVRLPVTVRRWCGLGTGDQVWLAADALDSLLVVYPPAGLDAFVTQASAALIGGGRS
jgi:bifunctional DNA-binding transcriptional regulator/antitoxin component of YhaV-PrlF toxin-antitoxin module